MMMTVNIITQTRENYTLVRGEAARGMPSPDQRDDLLHFSHSLKSLSSCHYFNNNPTTTQQPHEIPRPLFKEACNSHRADGKR
jgi:hypothetical protein